MPAGPEQHGAGDPWAQVVALAAGFAHEIKNPLSTIALNVQLLQEDWQNAATPREQRTLKRLGVLQREIARLTHLLDDFLRYARTRDLQPQPCPINQVVQEVLDFIAPQAARQKIEIRAGLAPDLPVAQADPKLLKQAILNLVLNAQDAMPNGGELLAQTLREGDLIRIDITDTGVGIPPNHLGKIFNVYFTTKEDGSGFGLPTTRRIAELHGGTIEVQSELHRGSRFTLRIPLRQAASNEGKG